MENNCFMYAFLEPAFVSRVVQELVYEYVCPSVLICSSVHVSCLFPAVPFFCYPSVHFDLKTESMKKTAQDFEFKSAV